MSSWGEDSAERAAIEAIYLGLPAIGARKRFQSNAGCLIRLSEIVWPEGPRCPVCAADCTTFYPNKLSFQCSCRHFFSPTRGTVLENRKAGLLKWFEAMEFVVKKTVTNPSYHVGQSSLSAILGVHRATAKDMLTVIQNEFRAKNGGIIAQCLVVKDQP